jgi:hypothetical protein
VCIGCLRVKKIRTDRSTSTQVNVHTRQRSHNGPPADAIPS